MSFLILHGSYDALAALPRDEYLNLTNEQRLQLFLGEEFIVEGVPNRIRRIWDAEDKMIAASQTLVEMPFKPGYRKLGLVINQFGFPWDCSLVWQRLGYITQGQLNQSVTFR